MYGKKVVVLGGAGFIGSHLVTRLIDDGAAEIKIIDNLVHGQAMPFQDSKDTKVIYSERDFRRCPPEAIDGADIVFNLAVLSLPHSLQYPEGNLNNNIQIVVKLLEYLSSNVYGKLVHFSSSEVYGSAKKTPMDESHPMAPSTPYAVSKAAGDLLCQSYWLMKGLPVTIIRPFNNYGPRQNDRSYAGVIPLTIKRLMRGEAPIIYGTGTQTRDYVYVEDTVEATIQVARDTGELTYGDVFNVATGRETNITDLICRIGAIYYAINSGETVLVPEFKPRREGDVHRHIGCGYKIKDRLGFEPKIDMNNALFETVKWYLDREKG